MERKQESGAALSCGMRGAVSFITLGCAKNEVDTRDMKRRLREAGYAVEAEPDAADAVIVNTCSFIRAATEESIDAILQAADLTTVESGEAALIVAGCMPARYGDELARELDEVHAFVPCSREDDIVAVVERALTERKGTGVPSAGIVDGAGQRSRFAYVKIADGCDRFCAYCTIPYIRGRYRSFPYEDIRAEVEACRADGAREIVLIAQDTGRYGSDLTEPRSLSWLLGRLADEFDDLWFRVMYLQPEGITDELLDVVATHDNICSYFDIPLQHANADILRAMNRTGSAAEFHRLFERIEDRVPDVTLRTTLMCGFPGETEEQFEELCEFVEEAPFDYIGVFAYSREEGTAAFDLPDQLDDDEKMQRAQRLRDLADSVCSARIARRIGCEGPVLVEGREEDGQLYGRAQCQAPEVDGVTYLDEGEPGEVVRVTITDTLLYEMEGERS